MCKADQTVEHIQALLAAYRRAHHWLSTDEEKGSYSFRPEELDRLRPFLLAHHRPLPARMSAGSPEPSPASIGPLARRPRAGEGASPPAGLTCPACRSARRAIQYGRYGYYFQCLDCETTANIQQRCSRCGRKARVRKQDRQFFAECEPCGTSSCFHCNPDVTPTEKRSVPSGTP